MSNNTTPTTVNFTDEIRKKLVDATARCEAVPVWQRAPILEEIGDILKEAGVPEPLWRSWYEAAEWVRTTYLYQAG
jgi:hypothetical protein